MPISKVFTKERQKDIDDHNSFNFINFCSNYLKKQCEKIFNLSKKKNFIFGFS